MHTLVLVTSIPHSRQAWQAVKFVSQQLADKQSVSVFFYGDAAYTANRLAWQTADVPSLSQAWVILAHQYNLKLPVCVSTALARGISDGENSQRHQLDGDNLLSPFYLAGLSELALLIDDDTTVVQF